MIIGSTFAWGHLPKAAGTATARMWQLLPELIVEADDEDANAKHDPFACRATTDKLLILNLRRLPAWILSHAQHVSRSGLYPDYQPIPLPTADELANQTLADDVLAWLLDGGRLRVDRWLRTEHLKSDFLDLVSQLTEVSAAQRRAIVNVGLVNAHPYNHDLSAWFSRDQIVRMYARNPLWSALEQRLYGDTLADRQWAKTPVRLAYWQQLSGGIAALPVGPRMW